MTKTITAKNITKNLADPLVSRAAARSGFQDNGDADALMSAWSELLADIDEALPGVDIAELRVALNAGPETIDMRALYAHLLEGGRSSSDADIICHAIDPSFALA